MDVFQLRNQLIKNFSSYIKSFIKIENKRINDLVENEFKEGLLWPPPLIQLNPSFEYGNTIDELCNEDILHEECRRIFRIKKNEIPKGLPLKLYIHQADAIRTASKGENYVLTTGTGSGKSLAYIIPIIDFVLKNGPGKGIKAIIVYPMNALANSQFGELEKFLCEGYPDKKGPVTFHRYTGQESDEEKQKIITHPPDVLLTNYVMMELILTRPQEHNLITSGLGLRFFVLDELHTYRGRQGADVAMLVRRVKQAFETHNLICVGTSATLSTEAIWISKRKSLQFPRCCLDPMLKWRILLAKP